MVIQIQYVGCKNKSSYDKLLLKQLCTLYTQKIQNT